MKAFPNDGKHEDLNGMSLRDYFAAKAMASVALGDEKNIYLLAQDAYRIADAMLQEREKSND
jgi:hypothetical protein